MHLLPQYAAAEDLERYLGDPFDSENLFSFKRIVELDEREEYPEEACELLNRWNFHHYYIPIECGGKLRSYEEIFSLVRVVARRDLTAAIAHAKTYLGAAAIWLEGTEKQKQRLAKIIKDEGQVSLGLTEKAHGSDLIANEFKAIKNAHGYLLSGEKWVINNATHGDAITIFARTDGNVGPRGFSLFLVEKSKLESSSYSYLPKIKTLGIRGADISGIRLKECLIPHDSLIGAPGSGLEVALKSSQITRTIISSLSLGAGDTALRTVLNFALDRKLYGDTVYAIPHAQRVLVDAFLDLLICECVGIAAARSLHVTTEQMSVQAAVVKYFVPTTIEQMVRQLAVVLGARYYLRESHQWGIFQKIVRDSLFTALIHFNSALNLSHLGTQLRQMGSQRAKTAGQSSPQLASRLHNIFSLQSPLPAFDPNKLELFNRGQDDVLQALEMMVTQLDSLKTDPTVEAEVLHTIIKLAGEVRSQLNNLDSSIVELAAEYGPAFGKSAEVFQAAKSHCVLHAAAACVQMWIHNRQELGEFFSRGEWLALSLERLMMSFHGSQGLSSRTYVANVAQELVRLYEADQLFSIIPLQLPRT